MIYCIGTTHFLLSEVTKVSLINKEAEREELYYIIYFKDKQSLRVMGRSNCAPSFEQFIKDWQTIYGEFKCSSQSET